MEESEKKSITDFSLLHKNKEQTIQKRIELLYNSMSFSEGVEPNWSSFYDCFTSSAQFINANLDAPMCLDVHTFAQVLQNQIKEHSIPQLFTQEVSHRTQIFGKIAQRFSVFANKIELDGEPTTQGINSIQLICAKGNWLIQSISWYNERTDDKIPTMFL
ncbi:hypothetical protein Fleli_3638 [Bernardetia litoralis DSM 6794]|uniref:SnoaL-like domain-containing protein n=1 Tax=Bernardetia litoralis (strain ATCC 23117 / DSM 6794 / NBRC 15988 / NCIMB 1366 / Fx l1 / Sio-4) TaxID=880071 RepID=I4APR9_BERLS|nr:hypothetical protein [Bernardetia litoralis]AFM05954.1 hypothetical protein Fleli_3638 [Bernardetia litoralis DSM 6794]